MSTIRTSRPCALAWPERPLGDVDGVALGALRVDGRADLLAERLQLLDRRRALRVAGGEGRRSCPRRSGAWRAWRVAVVLPEPCRPAIRITVGRLEAKARSRPEPPISSASSSLTTLTTIWPGIEALEHACAEARSLDAGDELLDDLEVDVGLEQREADLAHRLVDVVLAQLAARAQVRQRALQAV